MEHKIVIRTGKDRLRYTCAFELFLLIILAPIGAIVFDRHLAEMGLLSVVLSLKAMVFNLIYNWIFDLLDVRAGKIPTQRSFIGRMFHAIGFEFGLFLTSLPIVMWWLGLSLWQAILMDLVVTSFVVIYTFVFTWGYDRLYPVEQYAMGSRSN